MLFIFLFSLIVSSNTTITFKSQDEITITADLYMTHDTKAPFIILFHQAGWSRGEYLEIAPKLNAMGFNCLAVDQRSGGEVNGVKNQSKAMAEKAGKGTRYVDAIPDMLAAIDHVKKNYAKGKLLIWGSSYSSALTFPVSSQRADVVDGILAFSPGEYFSRQGKTATFVQDAAANLTIPAFITSAKNERKSWQPIFDQLKSKNKVGYLPQTKGNHGSRALWKKFSDHQAYWNAVEKFLQQFKS